MFLAPPYQILVSLNESTPPLRPPPPSLPPLSYVEHQNVPNATYEELEAEVQAACNELPSPYGAACNNTVQNFLEPIVDELEADTPPAQVCSAKPIMLCSSADVPAVTDLGDPACTYCEMAVKVRAIVVLGGRKQEGGGMRAHVSVCLSVCLSVCVCVSVSVSVLCG